MTKLEKVIMGLALFAICAVLIFDGKREQAPPPGYTPDPVGADAVGTSTTTSATGPAYLVANRPWMMPPPLGIILPVKTDAPAALYSMSTTCGDC